MSKDYKPAPPKAKPAGKNSPFISGLLVGLLLGIGASVIVAFYVMKGESAFQEKVTPAPEIASTGKPAGKDTPPETAPVADAPKKEDRFTFYGILTGSESPVTEQEVKQATEQKTPQAASDNPAAPSENYFLQVGAFQTEQEADNTKAKLALIGLEAVVQTATIPEKGVLHRVRVGPLANLEEINKARSELARNGFDAALIKIHNNVPDQ
jgi:cell division protein FtsN